MILTVTATKKKTVIIIIIIDHSDKNVDNEDKNDSYSNSHFHSLETVTMTVMNTVYVT